MIYAKFVGVYTESNEADERKREGAVGYEDNLSRIEAKKKNEAGEGKFETQFHREIRLEERK
jgi:hypothetical protein